MGIGGVRWKSILCVPLKCPTQWRQIREQICARQRANPTFVDVFQQLINGLPEQIALLDEDWNILAVNEAWTKTAALYGYSALQPGTNYVEFCRDRAKEGHDAARPAVEGIMQIDSGACNSFRYLYDGNDRWEGHTFQLCINRLEIAGRTLATITRYDVTELMQLGGRGRDMATR